MKPHRLLESLPIPGVLRVSMSPLVEGTPVIRDLMQKLGFDRIGDLVADQVRQVQLDILREERDVLARMMSKRNERIREAGGKPRGRPPKATSAIAATPTRRPRRRRRIVHAPGQTLRDMVVKALAKAGGPVKATTLVEFVKELGYRTTAKPSTLLTSIYHILSDTKLFRKMGRGVSGLVAAPAARQRTPTKRKKAGKAANRKPAAAETETHSERQYGAKS